MTTTAADAPLVDHVIAITRDVFTAMIDGEAGLLIDNHPDREQLTDPVHAWVEICSPGRVRVVVSASRSTGEQIVRALLGMEPGEMIDEDELTDALGEVANVIGGNVKGIMSGSGNLTLPEVTLRQAQPPDPANLRWDRALQWRGETLMLSMWDVPETEGEDQ